jgi:hypothetical protein
MQASSQPALLDLLALGPVRELILKHLSSGGKKAMMQACKAMRREASGVCKMKPYPIVDGVCFGNP